MIAGVCQSVGEVIDGRKGRVVVKECGVGCVGRRLGFP